MESPSEIIHTALQAVSRIRQRHADVPALAQAGREVKRFQAARFQASYSDLLHNRRYAPATQFFLLELYSDKDYSERDQQFARIANTIARLFPQSVVDTAAALAQVHAMTEELDDLMAQQWLASATEQAGRLGQAINDCTRYVWCWRRVADAESRQRQLDIVLNLGRELDRLTGKPGLRTVLKLMRRPAAAAGLSSLQHFLETGFDAFAEMKGAHAFLTLIAQREAEWIRSLFSGSEASSATQLAHLLAATPQTQ